MKLIKLEQFSIIHLTLSHLCRDDWFFFSIAVGVLDPSHYTEIFGPFIMTIEKRNRKPHKEFDMRSNFIDSGLLNEYSMINRVARDGKQFLYSNDHIHKWFWYWLHMMMMVGPHYWNLTPVLEKNPMMKEEQSKRKKINSPEYLYAHNNRLKFAMTIKIHAFD